MMLKPSEALIVGLVQQQWYPDPHEHKKHLERGIAQAAKQGARLICLQELTLSPYFCSRADVRPDAYIESIETGPSSQFASAMSKKYQVFIVISLVESGENHNCYNTAITVAPDGTIIGKTRKQHIPSGEGYNETNSFTPGAALYPLHNVDGHKLATPTCYDQWFPELARIYGQKGAEIIAYPTAIGGEPTALDFDSQPMWQAIQVSHAIANNCFIIAANRIGTESMGKNDKGQEIGLTLYGSSFICAPNGKILAQAPRAEPAVLVATLDFALRDTCRRLFPFIQQRRPEDYVFLTQGQNPDLLPNLHGTH
ncbi:MAG: nitrilase-related carbon-nitrogen hydrolase [Legionellales bacterium]